MELAAIIFGLIIALCLLAALPYARRWARNKQASKARAGEYAVPVNPWLGQLGLIFMSTAGLGMGAVLALAYGFVPEFIGGIGFVILIVGMIGCFVVEALIRNRKKKLPRIEFAPNVRRSTKDNILVVSVPELTDKHTKEIWIGNAIGTVFALCLIGCISYFLKFGFAHYDATLSPFMRYSTVGMAVSIFCLIAYSGFIMASNSKRELILLDESQGRHFVLSEWGIECSIGLIEGDARTRMRNSRQGVFRTPWASVSTWSVEPAKRAGNRPGSPPYYKLSLKPENIELFIQRSYLAAREKEILDFARQHLQRPMELRDSAYM